MTERKATTEKEAATKEGTAPEAPETEAPRAEAEMAAPEPVNEAPDPTADNPTAAMAREIAATGHPPETTAEMPEAGRDRGAEAHAPSSPGQATAAEKDLASATLAAAPLHAEVALARQRAEASDNEIERMTRQMAADGASAGEIALAREVAFTKLGE